MLVIGCVPIAVIAWLRASADTCLLVQILLLCRLSADEQHRNRLGDMLVFQHVPDRHEPEHCNTTLPQHFSSVIRSHSVCRNVPPPAPLPDGELGYKPLLIKGTRTGKHNPPGAVVGLML